MSSQEGQEETYEVETVTKHRIVNGITYYNVKWKGYDDCDNTWERADDLTCTDLINEYMAKQTESKGCSADEKIQKIPNPPFK